jgi:hypothetical protein
MGQTAPDKLVTAEVLIAYEAIENNYQNATLVKNVIEAAQPFIETVDNTDSNLLMAKTVYAQKITRRCSSSKAWFAA